MEEEEQHKQEEEKEEVDEKDLPVGEAVLQLVTAHLQQQQQHHPPKLGEHRSKVVFCALVGAAANNLSPALSPLFLPSARIKPSQLRSLLCQHREVEVYAVFAVPTVALFTLRTNNVNEREFTLNQEFKRGTLPCLRLDEAAKFAVLLLQGNPNALEALYIDRACYMSDEWRRLRGLREECITQYVVLKFVGHSKSYLYQVAKKKAMKIKQMNRLIDQQNKLKTDSKKKRKKARQAALLAQQKGGGKQPSQQQQPGEQEQELQERERHLQAMQQKKQEKQSTPETQTGGESNTAAKAGNNRKDQPSEEDKIEIENLRLCGLFRLLFQARRLLLFLYKQNEGRGDEDKDKAIRIWYEDEESDEEEGGEGVFWWQRININEQQERGRANLLRIVLALTAKNEKQFLGALSKGQVEQELILALMERLTNFLDLHPKKDRKAEEDEREMLTEEEEEEKRLLSVYRSLVFQMEATNLDQWLLSLRRHPHYFS
ncbi:hypothetical protein QOT17_021058 [Balamuthia mandrillaris]